MTQNPLYRLNCLPRLLSVVTPFMHPHLNFRLSNEPDFSFLISITPAYILYSSNTDNVSHVSRGCESCSR